MDYQQGTAVTLTETFTVNGVLTDPTTIEIHVRNPDGTEDTYEFGVDGNLTKRAVGIYDLLLSPSSVNALGTYQFWGVGTGGVDAVSDAKSFRIVSMTGDSEHGPCEPWVSADEVEEFCAASESSLDFTEATDVANQVLFALVPRYSGVCGPIIVRPCGQPCGVPWTPDSGWRWVGGDWTLAALVGGMIEPASPRRGCGCNPLSRVLLAGRVRDVLEVKIDGSVIQPSAYRVDNSKWLTRIDGDTWPGCQDMTASDTAAGSFSVEYTFGVSPPADARLAAKELACSIFQTIQVESGALDGDCPLPNSVTRVTREGITVDLKAFTGWGWDPTQRQWQTGLPLVDMFLNARNPEGRRKRRAVIWSPDLERPATRLGQ